MERRELAKVRGRVAALGLGCAWVLVNKSRAVKGDVVEGGAHRVVVVGVLRHGEGGGSRPEGADGDNSQPGEGEAYGCCHGLWVQQGQ